MPEMENEWADECTTWSEYPTQRVRRTNNYNSSALMEAFETTSIWQEGFPSTLPARKQDGEEESEDVLSHTHTEDQENSADEWAAWGFDGLEAHPITLEASRSKAPTQKPEVPPIVDKHAAATTTTTTAALSHLQSSLAAHLSDRTSALPAANPTEVARVRRFLRWMMVTDYTVIPSSPSRPSPRAIGSITLPAADRAHFLHLASLARRLEALHAIGTPSATGHHNDDEEEEEEEEHDVLGHYFWQFVHAPCAALGLHASILLGKCLDLAQFSGVAGWYDGAERGTISCFGVGRWARRIFVDREIVMPALFAPACDGANAYFADGGGDAGLIGVEVVRDAIAMKTRRYFEVLDGFEGLVMEFKVEGRWMFSDVCKFRLNERGTRLDASRTKGASGFGYMRFATLESQRRLADDAVKSLEQASSRKNGDVRLKSDAVFRYMPWVPR